MFPGGFSAGDEPDGSAKFFATAFQNAKMKEAVEALPIHALPQEQKLIHPYKKIPAHPLPLR